MEQKSILNYMGGGNKRKLTSVAKNEKPNEKVDDSKTDNGEPNSKHQKIDEAANVDKMEILGMPITNSKWIQLLQPEFQKPYFKTISDRLQSDFNSKIAIFPPKKLVFQALNSCPIENIKVVILGQDPYFQINQANGLSFSVSKGVRIPPSLRNMFQELVSDEDIKNFTTFPTHGDLQKWSNQGVLLLNASLTVQTGKPNSHSKIGWHLFTNRIIELVSQYGNNVVFLLWGNDARSKKKLIDLNKHCVLEAVHPSPLSASKGFLGCKHFSKANAYLIAHNREPIDWTVD